MRRSALYATSADRRLALAFHLAKIEIISAGNHPETFTFWGCVDERLRVVPVLVGDAGGGAGVSIPHERGTRSSCCIRTDALQS